MIIRVIDTETCGLPPDNLQIVEFATVDLVGDGNAWTRGHVTTTLINPQREIPPEASAVHHITDSMVKDAPTIDDVKGALTAGSVDHFAAHEAKFEKAALPWLADRVDICTRKVAMTLWPDAPNHKNQTLRYWLGLNFETDPGMPHRALGDACVTAAVLRRMLLACKEAGSADEIVADFVGISAGPVILPRLTFGEHAMKPCAEVPTSYWDWIVNKSRGEWDPDVLHTARTFLDRAPRAA